MATRPRPTTTHTTAAHATGAQSVNILWAAFRFVLRRREHRPRRWLFYTNGPSGRYISLGSDECAARSRLARLQWGLRFEQVRQAAAQIDDEDGTALLARTLDVVQYGNRSLIAVARRSLDAMLANVANENAMYHIPAPSHPVSPQTLPALIVVARVPVGRAAAQLLSRDRVGLQNYAMLNQAAQLEALTAAVIIGRAKPAMLMGALATAIPLDAEAAKAAGDWAGSECQLSLLAHLSMRRRLRRDSGRANGSRRIASSRNSGWRWNSRTNRGNGSGPIRCD